MAKVITETGTKGFWLWMKANQPRLYQQAMRNMAHGVSTMQGLGDSITDPITGQLLFDSSGSVVAASSVATPDVAATASAAPTSTSIADSIKNFVTGAAQIFLTTKQVGAQQQILDAQLTRAKAGLPPLNINPASYGLQPTIGVGLTSSTQNLFMYGGIALLALLALGIFKPKRA